MQKILSWIVLFSLIFFQSLTAQEAGWCGFSPSPDDIAERVLLQKEIEAFMAAEKNGAQDRSLIAIPVKAHVFRRDDGTWDADSARIVLSLEKVNEWFAQSNVGISLYLCGNINYINNTRLYERLEVGNVSYGSGNYWISKIRVPYALNMIVARGFSGDGLVRPGFASLVNTDLRGNFCIADTAMRPAYRILAHEVAHTLGLYHTFGTTNFCWYTTNELADGSNCKYTGDFICDTKATPCLGYAGLVDANCKYTGKTDSAFDPPILDANGQPFKPDVSNIMSYAPNACISTFTPEQGAVMRFYAKKYFDFSGNYCGPLSDYCAAKGENTDYGFHPFCRHPARRAHRSSVPSR